MSKPRHIPSPFFDNCMTVALVVVTKLALVGLMAHTAITQGPMS